MAGYTKLFSSIIASTIWREEKETKIVWITLLAMANAVGRVDASVPGLADLARVSVDECANAIEVLCSPDSWSRSKQFEGRRLEAVDGGWVILNYQKYRENRDSEIRRDQNRIAQAKWRDKNKQIIHSKPIISRDKPASAQAEAEADAEALLSIPSATLTIADGIYALYPRKQGKKDAIKAINGALKTCPKERLTERTQAFALAVQSWSQSDKQFIPHPATWFNRGSYDDDPAQWVRKTSTLRASFA